MPLDLSIYKRILPIGTADFMNELSAGFIVFVFNHAILKYIGDNGIVTYTIITYIYNIVMMTFTGISQGMQPLVSFYRGKKEPKTCALFLRYGFISTLLTSIVSLAICLIGTPLLVSIFLDPATGDLFTSSVQAFREYSLCYLVIGYNIVASGYFAANEQSRYSFTISVLRGFIMIALSVFIMGYLFQGDGIWYATFVCEAITLLVTIILLWKQKKKGEVLLTT